MKCFFIILIFSAISACTNQQSASSKLKPLCDTVCLKDSIKFVANSSHKTNVFISAKNCIPDSISWLGMGLYHQIAFHDLFNKNIQINAKTFACKFNDTAYAWIVFNDCATGRSYQAKLPFSSHSSIIKRSSALNNFDEKFNVLDGLLVFTDRGNLFIEDAVSGKQATMTFGEAIEVDYDEIHESIDSVHVTATHAWAKINTGKKWKIIEKNITLK